MSSRVYLAVGCKFGDIASILPVLHKAHLNGERVHLMVAKQYASLLKGTTYVYPLEWEGEWYDLRGAMKSLIGRYDEIVCVSTFGHNFPIEHRTPSFQLDAFDRAGALEHFGEWPLVFDNRKPRREKMLTASLPEKFILLADAGESSPFNEIENLRTLLKENFPEHTVVDLSKIRAEFIFDVLAVYDKAAALVTTETVHLHLSAASPVPVIALATDRPNMWHGSTWHPRFKLHCRYSDFSARRNEIVQAVKDAIIGNSHPMVESSKTAFSGYNPTCIEFGGRMIFAYRYHPDKTHWRTQLALNTTNGNFQIEPPAKFKDYSLEDARMFVFKERLHISYVCARTLDGQSRCVQQYGELNYRDGKWMIENHRQPLVIGNEFSGMQKNWSFFESGGKLYCATHRSPEQIVHELDGEKVVKTYKTKTPQWEFGQMRGGTAPIQQGGLWLQFFHTQRRFYSGAQWVVGALLMEPTPPFQILSVSKRPVLVGNERYFPYCKFWKPNVTICYGAVSDGDNSFRVSVGLNDSACGMASITREQLYL